MEVLNSSSQSPIHQSEPEAPNNDFHSKFTKFLRRRLPILTWLPTYNFSFLMHDILAGVTVGLTEIPQGIAFALIAGLTPEYGLYCGFMDGFIYAVFGTCKDVNIGPTSILALMIQPHVAAMGADMAVIITFLAGIIIFALGCLNLGFVVQFFSYPIIAGFTCAASLQIASTQVKSLLGIPGKADKFLEAWESVFENIDKVKLWDSLLGILSVLFLVVLKEVRRFGTLSYRDDWTRNRNILGMFLFMLSLARNSLVVLIGGLIAYGLRDDIPFAITGTVKAGFPPVAPPPFSFSYNGTSYDFVDIAENYGPALAFLPLVAILEAISIAKAFTKGTTLNATQEMLALGLCNLIGSFVRSMPVTGSFTRTAVNNASGVKTPLAGIFTSFMVLMAIGFLTPSFYFIPKATLASVVICAMFYLFDYEAFTVLWKHKKLDLIPFLATLLCCLFISLEYGILIGIGVNLLFVLYSSARPDFSISKDAILTANGSEVILLTPKDTFFYPAAEFFRDQILRIKDPGILIVIDGKNVKSVDITVAKIFAIVVKEVTEKAQTIVFLNFASGVADVCSGVDPKMLQFFHTGTIEDVVKGVSRDSDDNQDVGFVIQ